MVDMIGLVEKKKKWNLSAFESVADAFDREAKQSKGDKGVWITAALTMFLRASEDEKVAYIDIIKRAEGRTFQGTVMDEARKIMTGEAEAAGSAGEAARQETDGVGHRTSHGGSPSSKKKRVAGGP